MMENDCWRILPWTWWLVSLACSSTWCSNFTVLSDREREEDKKREKSSQLVLSSSYRYRRWWLIKPWRSSTVSLACSTAAAVSSFVVWTSSAAWSNWNDHHHHHHHQTTCDLYLSTLPLLDEHLSRVLLLLFLLQKKIKQKWFSSSIIMSTNRELVLVQ